MVIRDSLRTYKNRPVEIVYHVFPLQNTCDCPYSYVNVYQKAIKPHFKRTESGIGEDFGDCDPLTRHDDDSGRILQGDSWTTSSTAVRCHMKYISVYICIYIICVYIYIYISICICVCVSTRVDSLPFCFVFQNSIN